MTVEPVHDEALADELAGLINAAYAIGEAGLWIEGTQRTTPDEIAEAIRSGGLLAARQEAAIVGCAYVRPLDAGTADLSLMSAATGHWGSGVGGRLAGSAEELMRSRGVAAMQLELLVPKARPHPEKERLRAWYTRLGYRVIRTARFEEVVPGLAGRLATPCEFLIFRKPLSPGARPPG
jgi:GNAT superfamily N-acetyltransferase